MACWRPLWAYGTQLYIILGTQKRNCPMGWFLTCYRAWQLILILFLVQAKFSVICCIAKCSGCTVAMLFGLSEPLQFPEPEVSLAECCYRGLLNANMVVGRKRNPRLFTNFPSSHGLDTRGFMVVRWLVPVFNWRKHLQSWRKLHLASPVGRSDTLGSLVALAVVPPPVQDANFCSPFQAAIVENQICRLDYLSWPSLTTVYAYPVTPKVIFFKIFERWPQELLPVSGCDIFVMLWLLLWG